LEGSLVINGSVSSERRQEIVDLYQNDENTKIIIGQIQAAGVGLTLTAGSNVIFIELPWSALSFFWFMNKMKRLFGFKKFIGKQVYKYIYKKFLKILLIHKI
jgi:SWI/SNF-related matrix-associated actin-dependent regulator 1 of chromatin subfamily A